MKVINVSFESEDKAAVFLKWLELNLNEIEDYFEENDCLTSFKANDDEVIFFEPNNSY